MRYVPRVTRPRRKNADQHALAGVRPMNTMGFPSASSHFDCTVFAYCRPPRAITGFISTQWPPAVDDLVIRFELKQFVKEVSKLICLLNGNIKLQVKLGSDDFAGQWGFNPADIHPSDINPMLLRLRCDDCDLSIIGSLHMNFEPFSLRERGRCVTDHKFRWFLREERMFLGVGNHPFDVIMRSTHAHRAIEAIMKGGAPCSLYPTEVPVNKIENFCEAARLVGPKGLKSGLTKSRGSRGFEDSVRNSAIGCGFGWFEFGDA